MNIKSYSWTIFFIIMSFVITIIPGVTHPNVDFTWLRNLSILGTLGIAIDLAILSSKHKNTQTGEQNG